MWNRNRATLFMLFTLLASSSIAWACNVPVFRYALDHWRPDAYRAVILHKGPLNDQSRTALAMLNQAIEQRQLNLTLQQIDINSASPEQLPASLGELVSNDRVHVLLHYPSDLRIGEPVVSMPLESKSIEQLVDSPLRLELLKRLADGQSAVWLLVASGNESADTAARQTLTTQLQTLQSTLELPKLTDDPEDAIKGGPALRIEFSILELAKDNTEEWMLRSMLLGSEPDLHELDEPMVFPVFGCGRALWPLVGAGITADNLRESATFVSGACSCQVKEQNPGFDLLIKANWSELLPWTNTPESTLGLGQPVQVAETIPIPSGNTAPKDEVAGSLSSATTSISAPAAATSFSRVSPSVIVASIIAVGVFTLVALVWTQPKKSRI